MKSSTQAEISTRELFDVLSTCCDFSWENVISCCFKTLTCTYISLTDTQMFVGNFKGHTGWVPLHDRCQPFPRHDFGRWSDGRSACSYSLFPGLRIGRNKRFQIEEVIVSILNFASFFPSRWPLLFNLSICNSSQRIAYTKTSQKRQKLHGV